MTLLDDIIDGSTDNAVTTADLLRKVQIVATRLGASDILAWVRQELQGYAEESELPSYRIQSTNVLGMFTGPMQSRISQQLPVAPRFAPWFIVRMNQPLIELEAFASADDNPVREWQASWVQSYEQSGLYTIEFFGLFSAHNVISRPSLKGIIDTVRTKAMEFALELQAQFPEAGSYGGPTVDSDSGVASTIYNITNHITGHGTNVATGSNIRQRTSVREGDVEAFKERIHSLGLTIDDTDAFVETITADQDIAGPRVRAFLERVRTGAVVVAGSISSDVIAGSLIEAGKGFLGIT